ncbi:MAG: transposase family protein [Paludibacter sp.]
MPIYSNNILSLTIAELEQCGLSAGYLKSAVSKQRKGEVYCWEHHKIGRQIFIHYDALLVKYKTLVRNILCAGVEPKVFIANKETNKNSAVLNAIAEQLPGLVSVNADDIKKLMETQLYTATEVHQLARAAGWLRILNEYDTRKVRSLGYKSVDDFRESLFKCCLNEQILQPISLIRWKKGTITNMRVLMRNAVEFKRDGIESLIHKGVGNVNREMADTQGHAKMLELASNRVKYSWEDVTMMFNDWADAVGKPNMTTSAVKAYLNIPKIKKVWYYARHGKLAGDNDLQPLMQRDTPSFPDALWSIDGTTTQLYYRDDKGKIVSDLYAYFVTDANSGAIIGHSIAFAETSGMVTEALKNAIDLHGYKPYQIQYDNSSANVSYAVQALMSNMSRVHFPCEPYKGRSKYVESIIGHFQQRVLRKRENFKGGNIDTKRLNSKANPELLKELSKNPELLPSFYEVMDEFNKAVAEWNTRGEKRDSFGRFVGDSKIHRYKTIEHEKRSKMNYFDKLSLFVIQLKDTYKYGTQGVEIVIDKKKYNFIVPDPDSVGDFMFANEHLGEKFEIRIDMAKPEMCVLMQNGIVIEHAYEKERYSACVADLKEGENTKKVAFKSKQTEFGINYSITELERQMSILGELKATGTDGMGWWDTSKSNENARNNQNEDKRNGVGDGYTDIERKILNIGK